MYFSSNHESNIKCIFNKNHKFYEIINKFVKKFKILEEYDLKIHLKNCIGHYYL